jgi:hypothetical protein
MLSGSLQNKTKQNKTKGLNGACGEHAAQNWQLSRVIVH